MRTEIYEGEPAPLPGTGLEGVQAVSELLSVGVWTVSPVLVLMLAVWMWLGEHRLTPAARTLPREAPLLVLVTGATLTGLGMAVAGMWSLMLEHPLSLAVIGLTALLAALVRAAHLPLGLLVRWRASLGNGPALDARLILPGTWFLLSIPFALAPATDLLADEGDARISVCVLLVALSVLCSTWVVLLLPSRRGCSCSPAQVGLMSPEAEAFAGEPLRVDSCTAWKVARIRAAGSALWLEGVAGGHYGAHEEARCNRGGEHLVPDPECTCGFHAWSTRQRAESYPAELAEWCGDPQGVVALEVELGGDILEYERGFRAQFQDVLGVHLPACQCGNPATHLDRRRASVADVCVSRCTECASPTALSLGEAASRLGVEFLASAAPARR